MTRRAIDRGTNHQPRHDYSLLAVLAALGPLGPRGYPEPLLGYGAYLLFEVYADADETATATAADGGGDGDDDARGDAGRASAVTARENERAHVRILLNPCPFRAGRARRAEGDAAAVGGGDDDGAAEDGGVLDWPSDDALVVADGVRLNELRKYVDELMGSPSDASGSDEGEDDDTEGEDERTGGADDDSGDEARHGDDNNTSDARSVRSLRPLAPLRKGSLYGLAMENMTPVASARGDAFIGGGSGGGGGGGSARANGGANGGANGIDAAALTGALGELQRSEPGEGDGVAVGAGLGAAVGSGDGDGVAQKPHDSSQ